MQRDRRTAAQIEPPTAFILNETLPVDKSPRRHYNKLLAGAVRLNWFCCF